MSMYHSTRSQLRGDATAVVGVDDDEVRAGVLECGHARDAVEGRTRIRCPDGRGSRPRTDSVSTASGSRTICGDPGRVCCTQRGSVIPAPPTCVTRRAPRGARASTHRARCWTYSKSSRLGSPRSTADCGCPSSTTVTSDPSRSNSASPTGAGYGRRGHRRSGTVARPTMPVCRPVDAPHRTSAAVLSRPGGPIRTGSTARPWAPPCGTPSRSSEPTRRGGAWRCACHRSGRFSAWTGRGTPGAPRPTSSRPMPRRGSGWRRVANAGPRRSPTAGCG